MEKRKWLDPKNFDWIPKKQTEVEEPYTTNNIYIYIIMYYIETIPKMLNDAQVTWSYLRSLDLSRVSWNGKK